MSTFKNCKLLTIVFVLFLGRPNFAGKPTAYSSSLTGDKTAGVTLSPNSFAITSIFPS